MHMCVLKKTLFNHCIDRN